MGNEVRVKSEKGSFITSIDDITGENTFTILVPVEPQLRLLTKPGETFLVSCVTERGLYMFEALVQARHDEDHVSIASLVAISDYKKIQRREAFRAKESVSVSARLEQPGDGEAARWVNTTTVNISETGMLLRFHQECQPGQVLELIIRIDNFGMQEILPKIRGKVARCTPSGSKQFGYLLGIHFESMPEKARDCIIRLVVLGQRSKLTYKHVNKRYR